jgi:hypothetical protein
MGNYKCEQLASPDDRHKKKEKKTERGRGTLSGYKPVPDRNVQRCYQKRVQT